ncbi:dCTP deaminase [Streptomyces sp. NPDC046374]|uniref:dCTP deaminase n=1 Tax=Streptomyces sp. NPDC046374 TaxID=3154917 RepID=UPI003411A7B1
MILTGPEIQRQRARGRLTLDPFDTGRIQPNSYDLTLGPTLLCYADRALDARRDNPVETVVIPDEGLVLEPERIYLGHSVETVGSDHYVPIVRARSWAARLGLFAHITADLIDIGSRGQITFQLHAVQPLRVHCGDGIAHVTFWVPQGEITLYDGKYQGSVGPQASRAWQDQRLAARG